ncbi:MAG: helix-turn-helix domain-containing protein [Dysgonamonadaceae bacterium]|jgi:transcriptional regulator with XRE-family HTH domain|nr:helix-turn-helix domain-containing protein [Dysgonamonadaceae bacterium]
MELKIKELLKQKGKTVVWLASEIGITQPNTSNIVNGKSSPSIETLEKIASALNVDFLDLFVDNRNKDNGIELTCPHCGGDIKVEISIKK